MLINFPMLFSRYFLIICLIYINAHVNSNLLIYSTCIWRFGTLLRATGTPGAFWRHTACSTLPVPLAPGLSRLGTQAKQAPGVWCQPRSLFPEGCRVSISLLSFLFLTPSFVLKSGGTSGKESICQCRRRKRCGFDPWVRKIPWRRVWQPITVFLPGEVHGQRSLVGYGP